MTHELKIIEEWDENVAISWWKTSRIALNKIIRKFNKWQVEYDFDQDRTPKLLRRIEKGKQTIGAQDGGSGYFDALLEMEEFVISKSTQ